MNEKKKIGFKIHIGVALVIVLLLVIGIVRLLIWNSKTSVIEDISDEDSVERENYDYVVYPAEDWVRREPDGTTRVVVLGNYMVNNYGKEHSIINILKENFNWEFIDLSVEGTTVASSTHDNELHKEMDGFCLYYQVKHLCEGKSDFKLYNGPFYDKERFDDYLKTFQGVDLNKVDKVIIMYAFLDYYNVVPVKMPEETDEDKRFITTYYGALSESIEMLREKYPHLEIIISTGYPEYLKDADGNMALGYSTNYGSGNLSMYISMEVNLAAKYCLTTIDNFYYKIDENNITTYVDKQKLTDAGIDLIAGHMTEILKKIDK